MRAGWTGHGVWCGLSWTWSTETPAHPLGSWLLNVWCFDSYFFEILVNLCILILTFHTFPIMAIVRQSQCFAFFCYLPAKHKTIDYGETLSRSQKFLQEENNLKSNLENFLPLGPVSPARDAWRGSARTQQAVCLCAACSCAPARKLQRECLSQGRCPWAPACADWLLRAGSGGYLSPCLRNHLCLNSWEFLIHS